MKNPTPQPHPIPSPRSTLKIEDGGPLLGESGVRQAIAASLFRERSLSLGLAAKFSGLGVAGFIQHVSRLGIPVVSGTADTVNADADVAETWQKGSS